jgi:predicted 2-oxoglutarate/Fe(II)-dependent dioxygenase YbiX
VLRDPNDAMANAVGATRPSVVIIGADMRLVAVLEGDALERALSICREMQERSRPEEVSAQVPVLMVRDVLDAALCRRLIGYWSSGNKQSDDVSSRQRGQQLTDQMIKKRTDVAVTDPDLLATLRKLISRRVTVEIHKAFNFVANHHETFRIGCYDATDGGYFRRHRDNTTPFTAHRRFAMSLNLNTGEYEGGQIRFPEYGRQCFRPDVGAAVIFSCSLLHEALPVTDGRRFALFSFFYDDAGAREEQEMMARERAKGHDVFK